jgi:hypothetical protein
MDHRRCFPCGWWVYGFLNIPSEAREPYLHQCLWDEYRDPSLPLGTMKNYCGGGGGNSFSMGLRGNISSRCEAM